MAFFYCAIFATFLQGMAANSFRQAIFKVDLAIELPLAGLVYPARSLVFWFRNKKGESFVILAAILSRIIEAAMIRVSQVLLYKCL